MAERLLVIGNKRYSSWSLRAWIGLRMLDVPFREERIGLDQPDTGERIRRYSGAGKVPVLVDGGLVVHDSLAILEYANEAYGEGRLLPLDLQARARARAAAAEMHSGFAALRAAMPMNLGRPVGPLADGGAAQAAEPDIARVLALWEALLDWSGGPYLCGAWGLADALYLPVATRLTTYTVQLDTHPAAQAYVERALAVPPYAEWLAVARTETEILTDEER